MGLITEVIAFFYHLPQIYKWLFKPYYILSTLMSTAFLILRECPGLCENLNTEREDRNPCDFDLVSIRVALQRCCAKSSGLWCYCTYLFYNTLYVILWGLSYREKWIFLCLSVRLSWWRTGETVNSEWMTPVWPGGRCEPIVVTENLSYVYSINSKHQNTHMHRQLADKPSHTINHLRRCWSAEDGFALDNLFVL
jgi:hypothetical protein